MRAGTDQNGPADQAGQATDHPARTPAGLVHPDPPDQTSSGPGHRPRPCRASRAHGQFSLLSSTAVAFHEVVPRVTSAGAGLWRVVTPPSSGARRELGTGLSAYEAAALVAANVPKDASPAVEGGWPDGPDPA
ncbi:DUF6193 family natural product biosynthesis protein [Kitasatospora sp. Root187]|uniref:DUF6193 family natural product biosynthesis protein n=1 Tax=Kitasatospora sp. Root187 TaxID=1736486 RepID=UPI00351739CC